MTRCRISNKAKIPFKQNKKGADTQLPKTNSQKNVSQFTSYPSIRYRFRAFYRDASGNY